MFVCVFFTLTSQVVSQYFAQGSCPETSSAPPINTTRYVAKPWYYIYSFNNYFEDGDSCSREDLKIKPDGSVKKTTTAIYNNRKRIISGIAETNKSGNGGLLSIYFIDGLPCEFLYVNANVIYLNS